MYFNDVPVNAPYICLNGALVYDTDGTLLRHNRMPEETLALLEAARKICPRIGAEVYVQDKSFLLYNNPMSQRHFQILGMTPPLCSLEELPPCTEWSKLNLTGEPDEIARLQECLAGFGDRFSTASAMPIFCEITSSAATKGGAVAQAAELCGISREHVYTAGDSANDFSMLRAFYSFAPENGEESACQAANEIVCDNDHGAIAQVVEILAKRYPA